MEEKFVVKLRGLPWSVTKGDVLIFLKDLSVVNGPDGVHLLKNLKGRLSGEAFVELNSEIDLEIALKRNNALMGHRYIEIFRSNNDQMNAHIEESNSFSKNWNETVVRLRGLPFGCTKAEILCFFTGINLEYRDILMVVDYSGRFNGEAFVKFHSVDDAIEALSRHKKMIGHRYIEVFQSCINEMKHYEINSNFSIKYNQNLRKKHLHNNLSNRNRLIQFDSYINEYKLDFNEHKHVKNTSVHKIKMRGLPFNIELSAIKKFFEPLTPRHIILFHNSDGYLNGEAEVHFNSHEDACEAMKHDRKFIGNRYIELFLQSGSNINNNSKKSNKQKSINNNYENNFSKFDSYILEPYNKHFY